MFLVIYLAVWFASLAMMVREGLWNNTITFINILVSGLVAFSFYQPLSIYLDEMLEGEFTYALDFVTIWGLFVITMLVGRLLTGLASDTRLRFKNPIDPVGGPLVALLASWTLAAFVMATLHTSPMPKDAFGGGLLRSNDDVASASALMSPDLGWLRFVERVTKADALGHSGGAGAFSASAFVQIYADHREKFDKANASMFRVRRS
jgi:hypothetical protein